MIDPRRSVPRTDRLLSNPRLVQLCELWGPSAVKNAARLALNDCREGLLDADHLVDEAVAILERSGSSMTPVINATGIVIHTNLGRAVLSQVARDAMVRAAGPTDVEMDLATGERTTRGRGLQRALSKAVPGAQEVHVVNNGAAALALAAVGLAQQRTIILARGEFVEIGDGFRVSDLLTAMGATIVEVGTTNRVHLRDYADACDERTGMILKVHPSNFLVRGFTSSVSVRELATLGPPLVVDIGSGLLSAHGRLPDEPDAATTLGDGADLVIASGDKLLGGPQAGLLLGRRDVVSSLKRHPFARAVRIDKLAIAALEATIVGAEATPTARALAESPARLLERARSIAGALDSDHVQAIESEGRVGGGGAPGVPLKSGAITLPITLAPTLRQATPAVVGYVHDGRLRLDLLMVPKQRDLELIHLIRAALSEHGMADREQ